MAFESGHLLLFLPGENAGRRIFGACAMCEGRGRSISRFQGTIWPWVNTKMGSHCGVGEFTAHFRTYFRGDWDVHWGYDLGFILEPIVVGLVDVRWGYDLGFDT